MAGLIGAALIVGGLIGLFGDTPLSYKCLSPLFILVGIGMIGMQISFKHDSPAPSDAPVSPGGWDEGSLAAFHYAKKDTAAAVNQVAMYIGSGDKSGFNEYFSGLTDGAWAQKVFYQAKRKAKG